MNSSAQSIFEAIKKLADGRRNSGDPGEWGPSIAPSVAWLYQEGLTRKAKSMRLVANADPRILQELGDRACLGLSTHRVARTPKIELDLLREARKATQDGAGLSVSQLDRLWRELKDPAGAVSMLAIDRMPADALAFYRPFHWEPYKEWGIYMFAGRLLSYSRRLYSVFAGRLGAFTLETLLSCVLFEVFHHEFFHHSVECAATTFEIASAGFGAPRSIYANYWDHAYREQAGMGPHPDHPLEEALANAYAYNSFSFLSRTEIGHKLLWVRSTKKSLRNAGHKNRMDTEVPASTSTVSTSPAPLNC